VVVVVEEVEVEEGGGGAGSSLRHSATSCLYARRLSLLRMRSMSEGDFLWLVDKWRVRPQK
jgi:hypothetical protein